MKLAPIAAALLCCACLARAEGPFSDLSFEAATAKAKADGKLLLVDFMASWCPPCKMMDKQTWPDEALGKWVGEHAIAIQVDIDKEPALAQRFGFEAIPTVIFLKDDKELDRQTGFRTPSAFLTWSNDVLAGKDSKTAAIERGRALLQSEDVQARYDAARELMETQQYDLALQHLLWLWPNSRKLPALTGVRLSYMLGDMQRLAEAYEPARKAFDGLLHELQGKVNVAGVPASQDWTEWFAMTKAFGQQGQVVAWYEAKRDKDGRLFASEADRRVPDTISDGLFDVLIDADRPVDAVRLYFDVAARGQATVDDFKKRKGMMDAAPESMRVEMGHFIVEKFRKDMATLRAATLASGQTDAAAKVAQQLLAALDDAGSRVALVQRNLEMLPTETAGLSAWLDQAESLGADVHELRDWLAKVDPSSTTAPPR
jgi:thiol-disulfide isomerase/thioredoxin